MTASKEFINRKLMADKDESEILKGADKVEADRIKVGGVNFALYNLVMSVVNFDDCRTSLDANRRLYEGLYPYINRIITENLHMRKLLKDSDDVNMKEILKVEGDLHKMASEMITKITKAAKKRSKLNLY